MLNRLYNPWQITNSGEREAGRLMTGPLQDDGEPIYILHQLRISSQFHKTQMAGECDFVIVSSLGITVMEVKGGVIGYDPNAGDSHGFFRIGTGDQQETIKNPFLQADANAGAIRSFLHEKECYDVFTGSVVCFPECILESKDIGTMDLWHRGCKTGLLPMIIESMRYQIRAFNEKQDLRNVALPIHWKTLSEEDILHVIHLLEPPFDPKVTLSQWQLNLAESARRLEEGLHILRGLSENRRIMVQGPPGSGKSVFACDLIRQQCRKGKKGLYICWNELLAASMQVKLHAPDQDFPAEHIRIIPYFHLVEEFALLAGGQSLLPTYDLVDRGEMKHLVKDCLNRLFKAKKLPKFDFIVADEAQDLFCKGLDLVLRSLLRDNNPLENGNYYIFFDDTQAFPRNQDLGAYVRTRDTLREASAYYMLFSTLRVNTGHGIEELIRDAGNRQTDSGKSYGKDVKFVKWKKPEELPALLNQYIDQERMLCHCSPENMIVLLTSGLTKESSPLPSLLSKNCGIELLTKDNFSTPTAKVRYTTALKAKGLEWDVVFLVTPAPDESILFQLYIGASRAKGKVFVFVCEGAGIAPPFL